MTQTSVRVQIRQRIDAAAQWTSSNPVLLLGEVGWESDTRKSKIGDGSTAWTSLDYTGGGGAGATGGGDDEWAIENDQTITTNYTITTAKNVVSVGVLAINENIEVTIPNNATWVVL